MRRYRLGLLILLVVLGASIGLDTLVKLPTPALARTNAYQIVLLGWGSGGRTSGGAYQMDVTISQPEADEVSGGEYRLNGGVGAGARVMAAPVAATPGPTPVAPTNGRQIYLPFVVTR